jgi:hypothetical protein
MSDRLALSSALSVLMMAGYMLFGSNAVQAPLGPNTLAARFPAESQLVRQVSAVVAALR